MAVTSRKIRKNAVSRLKAIVAEREMAPRALRAALKVAGENAAKSAFKHGMPVTFLRRTEGKTFLVKRYADGSEVQKPVQP